MERGRIWRHFDFWLIGAVALLVIFGIAMIRSTTLTSVDTDIQALPGRQIVFTLIGTFLRGPYWHFYWPWEPWPEIPARI